MGSSAGVERRPEDRTSSAGVGPITRHATRDARHATRDAPQAENELEDYDDVIECDVGCALAFVAACLAFFTGFGFVVAAITPAPGGGASLEKQANINSPI